jgi:hypothetical protein
MNKWDASWIALLSIFAIHVSSLTIIASYSSNSNNLTTLSTNASIPTVIFEFCKTKYPSNSSALGWLLPLDPNISLLDALSNVSQLPTRIPESQSQGLPQLLLSDFSKQSMIPAYYNELLPDIKNAGYDGFVAILPLGDLHYASFSAVRYWITNRCDIPLYMTGPNEINVANQIALNTSTLIQLNYQENTTQVFVRSSVYIIAISIPAYVLCLVVLFVSIKKLHSNHFPYIFNIGSVLCLVGILSAIVWSKAFLLDGNLIFFIFSDSCICISSYASRYYGLDSFIFVDQFQHCCFSLRKLLARISIPQSSEYFKWRGHDATCLH